MSLIYIISFSVVKIGDAYVNNTGEVTDFKKAFHEICPLLVSNY